jgi:hypothetical protein
MIAFIECGIWQKSPEQFVSTVMSGRGFWQHEGQVQSSACAWIARQHDRIVGAVEGARTANERMHPSGTKIDVPQRARLPAADAQVHLQTHKKRISCWTMRCFFLLSYPACMQRHWHWQQVEGRVPPIFLSRHRLAAYVEVGGTNG